jgi:hypothetical protein
MATDKDVAKLKKYVGKLNRFLRDQQLWGKSVTSNLKRLNRKVGGIGPGPNITDPPKPPKP